MYFVLLWKEHEELCPALKTDPPMPLKEKLWYLFVRAPHTDDDTESKSGDSMLDFLASQYEPKAFWFEVVECSRRLLLSSMLILVADGSAAQVVTAIFVCLASIKVYSYHAPFAEDADDLLAEVAQWQLFVVFFAALMIRVDASGDSDKDQAALAGLLVFVVASGFILMGFLTVYELYTAYQQHLEHKLRKLAKKLNPEADEPGIIVTSTAVLDGRLTQAQRAAEEGKEVEVEMVEVAVDSDSIDSSDMAAAPAEAAEAVVGSVVEARAENETGGEEEFKGVTIVSADLTGVDSPRRASKTRASKMKKPRIKTMNSSKDASRVQEGKDASEGEAAAAPISEVTAEVEEGGGAGAASAEAAAEEKNNTNRRASSSL